MAGSKRFQLDDETFDLINDPDDWTVAELIQVEDYFGRDVERFGRTRMMAAATWVSIHRRRPGFTLADNIAMRSGAALLLPQETPPEPQEEPQEPDVVLTPTNGAD